MDGDSRPLDKNAKLVALSFPYAMEGRTLPPGPLLSLPDIALPVCTHTSEPASVLSTARGILFCYLLLTCLHHRFLIVKSRYVNRRCEVLMMKMITYHFKKKLEAKRHKPPVINKRVTAMSCAAW